LAALLQESQKRNFERWPILGRPVNPNYFVASSFEEEVSWMKTFIQSRLDWMQRQFLSAPRLSVDSSDSSGRKAALSSADGLIYFTVDGTDPRARGGEPSSAARPYEGPIQLGKAAKLFARAGLESSWSGPTVFRAE